MKLAVALSAVLTAAAVTGCGVAAPLVTVNQLVAQCDALKGKPIRLAGYLGGCGGYDCHVAADQASWITFADAFSKGRRVGFGADSRASPQALKEASEAWAKLDTVHLIGVGGDEAFDRKAAPFQNRYVVITGRIADDNCTGEGGTDRSAGIHPTDIRAWTKSEGAPIKAN